MECWTRTTRKGDLTPTFRPVTLIMPFRMQASPSVLSLASPCRIVLSMSFSERHIGPAQASWEEPQTTEMTMTSDRTLAAAALIIAYATIIGFTDNFVTLIARNAGPSH